jgi:hypothetical protein
MNIGLLYEGDLDEKPLQIIILKLLQEINPQIQNIEFVNKPAHGSIEGQIRIALILFYETYDCDIAIFVADTDGKEDKQKRIKSLVLSYSKKVKPSSINIIGCPDPELEQWFLDEENAIKQIFSLPGNEALPYADMTPKERLRRIIDENPEDITKTRPDIYVNIAELMDFKKLTMSSRSFKSFYNAFKKVL